MRRGQSIAESIPKSQKTNENARIMRKEDDGIHSKQDKLVQAVTLGNYDSADSLLDSHGREIERVFKKKEYLIGNAVLYPRGLCHSFVLLERKEDGSIVLFDSWDGNTGRYGAEEVFYTGFLSAGESGIVKWVQYIV